MNKLASILVAVCLLMPTATAFARLSLDPFVIEVGGALRFGARDFLPSADEGDLHGIYEWAAGASGDADYFTRDDGCAYLVASGEERRLYERCSRGFQREATTHRRAGR